MPQQTIAMAEAGKILATIEKIDSLVTGLRVSAETIDRAPGDSTCRQEAVNALEEAQRQAIRCRDSLAVAVKDLVGWFQQDVADQGKASDR